MPIRKIITNKIFKYEKNFYFIFSNLFCGHKSCYYSCIIIYFCSRSNNCSISMSIFISFIVILELAISFRCNVKDG